MTVAAHDRESIHSLVTKHSSKHTIVQPTYNDALNSDIPVITISFVVTVKIYKGSMGTGPALYDWFSQLLYLYNDRGKGRIQKPRNGEN